MSRSMQYRVTDCSTPRYALISRTAANALLDGKQSSHYLMTSDQSHFMILSITTNSLTSYLLQAFITEPDQEDEDNIIHIAKELSHLLDDSLQCVPIRKQSVILNRVILQATNKQSLAFALDESRFRAFLLEEEITRIIGHGDEFKLEYSESITFVYKVLQCAPLREGLLYITNDSTLSSTTNQIIVLPSIESNQQGEEVPNRRVAALLQQESSPFERNPLYSFGDSLSLTLTLPNSLGERIKPLKVKRLQKSLHKLIPVPRSRNPQHEAVVSKNTLRTTMIASGTWIKIERVEENENEDDAFLSEDHDVTSSTSKTYISRLYMSDSDDGEGGELEDGNIYLSPLALYHLGVSGYDEHTEHDIHVRIRSIRLGGKESEFPCAVAQKVCLARIRSPNGGTHISALDVSRILKEPRIVCEGDVIVVPVRSLGYLDYPQLKVADTQAQNEELYQDLLQSFDVLQQQQADSQCFYYKVISVEIDRHSESQNESSNSFPNILRMGYVKKGITEVFEKTSVNSALPTCIESFHHGVYFTKPPGLESVFDQLLSIITPFCVSDSPLANMQSSILLHGARGNGKNTLIRAVCQYVGIHTLEINCFELLGQGDTQTVEALAVCFEQAEKLAPCVLVLRHISALEKIAARQQREPQIANALRDLITKSTRSLLRVITIATESKLNLLSANIRSCFPHEVAVGIPNEAQRRAIIRKLLTMNENKKEQSMLNVFHTQCKEPNRHVLEKYLAVSTAGSTVADLQSLVSRALLSVYQTVLPLIQYDEECHDEWRHIKPSLIETDLVTPLSHMQKAQAEDLGAPKIPSVQWKDVGGLSKAKKEILDTIQLPLQEPELFSKGVRQRSGVLLYGPPGTGKTLLAKAVATECSLNFLSVKGPELLNMYVGESERNVREVFEKARNAKPCVIFFDELDSLAPSRGQGSDSGGVMDRVVASLLAELDNLHSSEVFIIGATNRPDLLDSALLIPGRLDRLVYLGVSETHEEQLPVLKALTRNFHLADGFEIADIIEYCPLIFTGADFYAVSSDALLNAMKSRIDALEALQKRNFPVEERAKYMETLQTEPLTVNKQHFLKAIQYITPSVSDSELKRYKEIQDKYRK